MTEDDVRQLLRKRVERAGGQRAFSREHELNAGYVGRVLAGAKLSPAILDALGLEVAGTTTLYRRKRT